MRFTNYGYRTILVIIIAVLLVPFNFIDSPRKANAVVLPANPSASDKAKEILNYFYDLKTRAESGATSNRVISGQQVPADAFSTKWTDHVHHIIDPFAHTGKWIGIVGSEYKTEASRIQETQRLNKDLIKYWNNGHLITLNWHVNNPWFLTENHQYEAKILNADTVGGLLSTGTTENQNLIAMYDIIAGYLTELRDAGVVVLWRPYHEMNSKDFWYGGDGCESGNATNCDLVDTTQDDYARLWKHMFNYFNNTKGLNNLLWVYSPNNQWSSTSIAVDYFYPGSSYVDIVGQDVYAFDGITLKPNAPSPNATGSCDRLANLGKPFGLAEEGAPFNRDLKVDGSWDNRILMDKIKNECPKAVYFQQWNSWSMAKMAIIDTKYSKELLEDPWVVTREEFPWQAPSKDTQAPVISQVAAMPSTASPYQAKITWKTNEDSTSVVKYGTTSGNYPYTAKGLSASADKSTGIASNAVYLNGLQPNKTYYFVVSSTDIGGSVAQSSQGTFTTIPSFPSVTYAPDSQGYIKNWAVNGAFLQTNCFCGADSGTVCTPPFNEAEASPSVGDESGGRFWIDLNSSTTKIDIDGFFYNMGKEIDQMQATLDAERALSYAHAYVYSATTRSVQLRTGSDDGLKIWLNGSMVMDKEKTCRGYAADTDTTTVTLNQGWNRLLLAVADWANAYSYSARFTNSSGVPITDLQIKISNTVPSGISLSKEFEIVGKPNATEAVSNDTITYYINYSNLSESQTYTNISIDDPVPLGTSYVNGSAKLGLTSKTDSCTDSDGYCFSSGKATWTFRDFAPSETGVVSFQVKAQ